MGENGQARRGTSDADADTIRQTQHLLSIYPFASATPTTHVARHLSNLTISAAPPSYYEPSYYASSSQYRSAVSQNGELSALTATEYPQTPYGQALWQASQTEAMQLLGQHGMLNDNSQFSSRWNPSAPPSTYQPPPFVHNLFQHTAPYNAYPTPPPAPPPIAPLYTQTSSSLANALGNSTFTRPLSEPTRFFNDFLDEKVKELSQRSPKKPEARLAMAEPVHISSASHASMAMNGLPATPLTPLSTQMTPKKRKLVEVVIETPTRKHVAQQKSVPVARAGNMYDRPTTNSDVSHLNTPTRTPNMEVYVEVPTPRHWKTPSQNVHPTPSSDLGGYGPESDRKYVGVEGLSTGKRTGNRDDRVPTEKFVNLLEDIFEDEDNMTPDADPSSISSSIFSTSTSSPDPLLQPQVIRRISKSLSKLVKSSRRGRSVFQWESSAVATPQYRAGGLVNIETPVIQRLLKILERSVRASEDLDPFNATAARKAKREDERSETPTTPQKSKTPRRSKTPADPTENVQAPFDNDSTPAMSLSETLSMLELCRNGLLAADCCIHILTCDGLDKQIFSEDLIISCLNAIKHQLTDILFVFIEAPVTDSRNSHPAVEVLVGRSQCHLTGDIAKCRELMKDIFQCITSVLTRIDSLLSAEEKLMNESIIIPAVYIAIGPFFVIDTFGETDAKSKRDPVCATLAMTLGPNAMRGLRLQALALVRSIFSSYDNQRSWIIEEILSSLVRLSDSKQKAGMFRLRDGRSIRTVSALLMQLVQSSSHKIRVAASGIGRKRRQQQALRRQDSSQSITTSESRLLDDIDEEEIRLYASGLEGPNEAAKAIVVYLTQRSGKSKSTKNSNEQEYRSVLDNLISDLLVVLFWPEWPAAGMILNIICRYMITSLSDVKSSSSTENQAMKAMALDHLGVVAGRLRSTLLKWSAKRKDGSILRPLDDACKNHDVASVAWLLGSHQDLANYLASCSEDDQSSESAMELTAVLWGQELSSVLSQLSEDMAVLQDSQDSAAVAHLRDEGTVIKRALQDIWKSAPSDVFDNPIQEDAARIDAVAEQIGCIQALRNAFEPILNIIIQCLNAQAVFVRTKALRALSHILSVDQGMLSNPSVKRAIELHLLDGSPQVREAAVDLIGKHMMESSSVAQEYYAKLADRIVDSGLGVRKRVIKLLKAIYVSCDDLRRKVDICSKLTNRVLDEDETVKDLAVKTMEELWFTAPNTSQARTDILSSIPVILGVCEAFKDKQSQFEELLSSMISNKDGKEKGAQNTLKGRFSDLCDALIDGLLDASEIPNFTIVNCVRAVHILVSVVPEAMPSTKASVLLSFLNSSTPEELIASEYILKIFRLSLPHMSKTSAKFGNELQQALQPMVTKPNMQGIAILPDVIATLCAVVEHLTHDFNRLCSLLRTCNGRLQQFIAKRAATLSAQDARTLHILVTIVSLLGENFNFDRVRSEHAGDSDVAKQINAVSKGPIVDHIYETLLHLYEGFTDGSLRGRVLICLGFMFRAQPTLMTLPSSAGMMDEIFVSGTADSKSRLLRVFQDFLVSESTKHDALKRESQKAGKVERQVNMEELVGNTQGFAESGVSSAIVQRYLTQIMDSVLATDPHLQGPAIDILTFTVKQGLAHPLTLFPVIIALETSPSEAIGARAAALHTIMHHKHASMLNAGFLQACRKSFDYQMKLLGANEDAVKGFREKPGANTAALLGRWYALVREKKQNRQEFFKAILKAFEVKDVTKTEENDIRFVRYMAENFASFDYKIQEEVLTVIKSLTRELAETGAQLVEQIAPGSMLAQLQTPKLPNEMDVDKSLEQPSNMSALPLERRICLSRSSCIVGIIMLLKTHLKAAYGLSEEKCSKFVAGKKSAVGDRPANRRKDSSGISWGRMPFATKMIHSEEDVASQTSTFLSIWHEDGASAEPDDEEWD